MKKRLLIIIPIAIALLAIIIIILLPLSPRFVRAVKNRVQTAVQTINQGGSTLQGGSPGSLISYNVPAFASSSYTPASDANDGSYDTTWRSQGAPAWLAYDLSGVPAVKRNKVLVAWYNGTGSYDHTIINYPAYNIPQNYTIDVNSTAGGGQPPTAGWVTLVKVQGNHYHSRQHVITMTGYNWIRIDITAIDGSVENEDASINMDIYDARTALADDWIFYGDSITAGAMGQGTINETAAFAQLIHKQVSNYYPVQESGGIGYLTSSDGAQHLNAWLKLFPGKYVGLSYGTNDALGCVNPVTFYSNYVTMVQDVLHAGKIPVIPYIPWGRNTNIQNCAPQLNAKISTLYTAFPQIIHGPNLWTFFQSHQDLISNDNIHPTNTGFAAYRQQWAKSMLAEVYTHQ